MLFKQVAKSVLAAPVKAGHWYSRRVEERFPTSVVPALDNWYSARSARTIGVEHTATDGTVVHLVLHAPTDLTGFRARTFSIKEPETLAWIDEFGGSDKTFFDIGANVGLYSLYYAKKYRGPVVAFEPSCLNVGVLARNVAVNAVVDEVCLFPLPLTSSVQRARFNMSDIEEGSALSSFGVEYGPDGTDLEVRMAYQLPGIGLDQAVEIGLIPADPALIKLDVDGIEHLILQGATRTLRSETLKSVLIEVDDSFGEAAEVICRVLSEAGFALRDKLHAEMFDSSRYATIWNQIWVRA